MESYVAVGIAVLALGWLGVHLAGIWREQNRADSDYSHREDVALRMEIDEYQQWRHKEAEQAAINQYAETYRAARKRYTDWYMQQ